MLAPRDASELEALEQRENGSNRSTTSIQQGDRGRVQRLLAALRHHARMAGVGAAVHRGHAYVNTIRAEEQTPLPGSQEIERRIKSLVRWNAMAMVVRANRLSDGIGGHISTYASAATLYEVGFNHFFRGTGRRRRRRHHLLPGPRLARHLRARVPRRPAVGREAAQLPPASCAEGGGLSSYPHPWLMPDFWQFPTVSMGLGPIMSIYQARFNRYLEDRGLKKPSTAKVWAFLGDGETDEPESLGAISLAAREKLDNLIFVINCNLQRLDGPVRGNGKIIQELEAIFRGAGWNVIKVLWGSDWDPLLAADHDGLLAKRMGEIVDGQYQKYAVEVGRLHPRALLRRRSAAARHGQAPVRRPAEAAAARRPRSGQGLQRLQGRGRAQGAADRHPRPDDQGLRPRRSRRRQEHHPPAEEDERGGPADVPHALRHSRSRTRRSPTRRSTVRRTTAPSCSTCASAARRSAASCRRARCASSRSTRRSRRCSRSSTRAPTAARPRRRWCSCGSCRSCCATRRSAS